MSREEKLKDDSNKVLDAAKGMIPTNLSEAEGMASMLAINMAADHLVERAMGKKLAAKATQAAAEKAAQMAAQKATQQAVGRAVGQAANTAAKAAAQAAAKEAAVRAAEEMAVEAAAESAMGPAGWVMLAVQVGGMLLDFFDPFNIARSYTNHDLKSMHDMMAGALTAALGGAKACMDPSFKAPQSATETQPEIMCLEDGTCIGMYPGTLKLAPPPGANCFELPFPSTAKPVMPAYDPRVPKVIIDLMATEEAQGALLLHNWLLNQTNADARLFADPTMDSFYRDHFTQALVQRWQNAGQPAVPPADADAPTNTDGESLSHTPAAQLVQAVVEQQPPPPESTFAASDPSSSSASTKLNTKATVIAILAVVAVVGAVVAYARRKPSAPLPRPMSVAPQAPPLPAAPVAPASVAAAPVPLPVAAAPVPLPVAAVPAATAPVVAGPIAVASVSMPAAMAV